MAYSAPQITAAGLSIPTYNDILADLVAQYRAIYGQTAYLDIDAADYQWISAVSAKISDSMQALLLSYNARSPLTATGAALDGVVKVNGIARKTASASTCVVTITGTPGATIYNGVIRDVSGYLWDLPATVVIGAGGSITATATCETLGRVAPLVGDLSGIATPQSGWSGVTNNAVAVVGQPVESDTLLRARQALSVATPSLSLLAGTQAAVAAIPSVTRYLISENPTNSTDGFGNPAHSITCVIEGGYDPLIAQAIYQNRGIGCYTNGTTTVNVTDAFTGAVMPIRFSRPGYLPIYASISVHPLTGYSAAVGTAIQNAIVAYLNQLQIGQTVVLSELYGAALSVRPDPDNPLFSIRALTLGTSSSPSGTSDITMSFGQVAQGFISNIVLTTV